MNIKSNFGYFLIISIVICSVWLLNARYVRQQLKEPIVPKQSTTYVVDDESYAVTLSAEDKRKIEFILKPRAFSDEDYNRRIDNGFIRRTVATCRCGKDAEMLERVLTDFKGETVRKLFTDLGLKGEL